MNFHTHNPLLRVCTTKTKHHGTRICPTISLTGQKPSSSIVEVGSVKGFLLARWFRRLMGHFQSTKLFRLSFQTEDWRRIQAMSHPIK